MTLVFLLLLIAVSVTSQADNLHSFSYKTENVIRKETVDPNGIITGFYDYLDANGVIQHVEYVADSDGFRVRATNLPIRVDVVHNPSPQKPK